GSLWVQRSRGPRSRLSPSVDRLSLLGTRGVLLSEGLLLVGLGVLEVISCTIVFRGGYEDLVSLLGLGILPTAAIGTWQAAREVRAHTREALPTGVLLLIVGAWLVAGRAAELAI